MRRTAVVLVAIVSLFPLTADANAQEATFGLNGAVWTQIEDSDFGTLQKLIYLRGIYDGLLFGQSQVLESFPPDPTWDALIAELDRFYAEPANRPIVVPWALQVVRLRGIDGPGPSVDALTAFYRCRSADLDLGVSQAESSCVGGIGTGR